MYFKFSVAKYLVVPRCRGFKGNSPISMADKGIMVYISADFGHKESDGNGNINLEGRKTKIVTDKKLKCTVKALSRLFS